MVGSGPVITWEFLLTACLAPLSVGLLYYGIKRMFASRDAKDAEIAKLRKEAELQKAETLKEWRDAIRETLCTIKKTVEDTKEDISHRVHRDECKATEKEVWDAIKDLRDKQYDAK